MGKQIFMVYPMGSTERVLCWANGCEDAKRQAFPLVHGDIDKYIVTPLTSTGDTVYFTGAMTLQG